MISIETFMYIFLIWHLLGGLGLIGQGISKSKKELIHGNSSIVSGLIIAMIMLMCIMW